jgi:L-alanine-DL-glutamate epimerase-like enolase superfamily enzyme
LQVEAAIPNFIIHEHNTISLRPAMKQITNVSYQPVKGRFTVPDLPGLGIELNKDFIKTQPRVIIQ